MVQFWSFAVPGRSFPYSLYQPIVRENNLSLVNSCCTRLEHQTGFIVVNIKQIVDYEQPLFFLSPSSKTRETRKWPRAWLKARDGRGMKKDAALVSRGSRLRRSRARALLSLNLKKKRERDCSQSKQIATDCATMFYELTACCPSGKTPS